VGLDGVKRHCSRARLKNCWPALRSRGSGCL
jgi:hypothetical protein